MSNAPMPSFTIEQILAYLLFCESIAEDPDLRGAFGVGDDDDQDEEIYDWITCGRAWMDQARGLLAIYRGTRAIARGI